MTTRDLQQDLRRQRHLDAIRAAERAAEASRSEAESWSPPTVLFIRVALILAAGIFALGAAVRLAQSFV